MGLPVTMSFRYEKPRESTTLYIKVATDNRWFIRLIKLKPSKVLIALWDKIDITYILAGNLPTKQ
ncbi:hypothetical protein C9J47_10010 [Photobacterium indicum]|uniref:Uncharacterized protein n=1 Tax=Photobacterium indicum TaxID=81447 RepID=A0A2T3LBX0_9GAMM|nr:hypothetical protein C9J47_10010 [Photobacterium indicum]